MTGFLASKGPRWLAGAALTGLVALFLIFDTAIKLIELPVVGETMEALGWSADKAVLLGVLLLAGTVLYVIPRTAVLGAVLLTAYLGGAVAAHLRIDSPLWSHVLFGVYVGVMMWGGLFLRRPGLLQVFVR
ncbi:DoxX family protein [Synechococcus moorigangaii CMS01]|nr:DoxX family protein [Synechococcus moorigangaii CMS01]